MNTHQVRLTSLAHGGGCGCKLAPSVLQQLLADQPAAAPYRQLLVGTETSDDAAVWQVDDNTCIIATTDFFMPMVDDPFDFGRIAATNAISDVYAMGGKPILALAIVGMPLDKLPVSVIGKILQGGESVCATAGIPIAGGHSIDTLEPIYGLVALGLVHPDRVKRNSSAKPGDVLVLGKPLGIGILSAALKKGRLSEAGYAAMLEWTTKLNTPGEALSGMSAVHALTDITGFGLAGHLLEICRGSKLAAKVRFDALPLIPEALEWVKQGVATGASERNWAGYGHDVVLEEDFPAWQKNLLTDPQTSGGLLVACSPDSQNQILNIFKQQGFPDARVIGSLAAGPARITVA